MASPTVSVIMSVFNEERHLNAAIESILSQTYSDFELVVIDDCSTDATADILNSYEASDSRVRVFRNDENRGLPASLNRAISHSEGGYIARMDADDVALPSRLARQVEYINDHEDVVVLGTGAHVIDGTGNHIKTYVPPTSHDKIVETMFRYNPLVHSSVLMRRTALEQVGYYDEQFVKAQDYELWVRLLDEGRFASLVEPLIKRRVEQNDGKRFQRKKQIYYGIVARRRLLSKTDRGVQAFKYLIRPSVSLLMPECVKNRL